MGLWEHFLKEALQKIHLHQCMENIPTRLFFFFLQKCISDCVVVVCNFSFGKVVLHIDDAKQYYFSN